MSGSGTWNTEIDMGADWRRSITVKDDAGAPIDYQSPAFMELREGPSASSTRIARLDATGTADGTITFTAGQGKITLFLPHAKTLLLTAGRYFFDLFVTQSNGELACLLHGTVTARQNTSAP